MSSSPLLTLIARCRALGRPRSQAADAELLARFAHQRDAAAFEELLERHAPLVWAVCRRLALSEADAEDAFQATFLALVRQASRLDGRQPLGGWLHTVAVRVARRGRSLQQATRSSLGEPTTRDDVADEVGRRELLCVMDEEIERLPAFLRAPVLLCCLQGRTRDEAAEALGCSVSAVKGRLERGRDLLRRRLERRGVQLPAAFLVVSLTGQRIRAALWAKTMQAALHSPPAAIVALAEAGLLTLTVGKGKLIVAALLLAASAAGVAGSMLIPKPQEVPLPAEQAKSAAESKKLQVPQVRTDRHGDPLPNGAIARLGTVRWRHGFLVHDLAYSPDGKMIAAVGAGRALTLWDAATGKEIRQFPNRNQPHAVAFSPDGKVLASTDVPICRLWDVATGKELRQLNGHTRVLRGVAFAPDGKTLATVGDDTARIWEASSGKELHKLDCEQQGAYTVAYSPDGKTLATAGKDGTIRLWDASTAKERQRLTGHKKEINKILFSPNGKQLASVSADETIRLWDAATGWQCRVLGEKLGEYSWAGMAFSPDGQFLASGHSDGTVRLWDSIEGTEKRRWQVGPLRVMAIAISPNSKTLAAGTAWDGGIRLWDMATGKEQHPSAAHHGLVDLVRFSPDGATLTSIGRDRCLLCWDLAAGTPRRLFTWTTKRFSRFDLSPNGNTLAVGGWPDSHLRLWDVRTGKPGPALGKPRQGGFWPIAFSPDGRLVASETDDSQIHVWDVRDGKEVQQLKGFTKRAGCLRFSPDSKALACGMGMENKAGGERTLRLWDLSSGKERCSFDSRGPDVEAIAFSPDGKMLASAENFPGQPGQSMVHLWDAMTGAELCRHTGHGDSVSSIAFSADGKLAASGAGSTGYRDNSVHVWEAATGRLIRRFEGHHSCVCSVDFSPDGLTVASGAGDSTILLWDITGRRSDGRWHAKPLTPGQMEACRTSLAHEDAAKAYDAVWSFVASPGQAVPFLQKHLPPVPRPDAKMVVRLIADLDSDDFMGRQTATEELGKLGDAIAPALRRALDGKPALEVRRRVQQLLDQTHDWTPERLRYHRAIQALEHIGTRQSKEVLRGLAEGAPGASRTEEAKTALQRMTRSSLPAKNP